MTYICVGYDFNYLSLITHTYPKKIVGYCLHQFLSTEGCLKTVEMALTTRTKQGNALIHHSDRGVQRTRCRASSGPTVALSTSKSLNLPV